MRKNASPPITTPKTKRPESGNDLIRQLHEQPSLEKVAKAQINQKKIKRKSNKKAKRMGMDEGRWGRWR